jgi:AcrR family transcriptional regulator
MESPKKKTETGEERRAAIAVAARQLIAERGFEGLRTRDIAERVGINIATLHYHVPSKEALIGLVAQSIRDQFIAQNQRRSREGLTPLQLLQGELADCRETMVDDRQTFVVLAELFERARRDEKVASALRPMRARWKNEIASILEAGRADGSFRSDLDSDAAATIIVSALRGAAADAAFDLPAFDRLVAELLRAVAAPKRGDTS